MKRTWCMAMAMAVGVMAVLALPGRLQAATYTATWVGGGDNLWNNASLWSTTSYPDNDQPNPGDTYDVTIALAGGTVNLNQSVEIEKLTFTAGTISNTGNTLTVNQLSDFGGSSSTFLTGTGTLVANDGLNFTPGFASNPSLRSAWTLNLYGTNTCYSTRGSGWYMRNTGIINIMEDATFDLVTAESGRIIDDATGIINVAGTLRRTINATEVEIQNQVNTLATGQVQATSGSLKLIGGGTHAGDFAVAAGNTLTLGGTHTFNSGASVNGDGNVAFTGASAFNTGATLSVGGNLTSSAVLSVAETTSVGGDLTGSGNGFQLNGAGTVNVAGRFYWSGGSAGAPSLSGSGTLNALEGMTLTGTANYTNGKTVNLYGDSSIDTTSGWWITNNGSYNVQPGATLELKATGGATNMIQGTGTINNQGTFFRAEGNERRIQNTLNNTGTVRVDAGGRFDFTGPVTQLSGTTLTGGTWHADGGTLNLPGSNLTTIDSGATVILENGGVINRIGSSLTNVNGTLEVNGMTFTPAATITVGTTGTLAGTGTVAANVVNSGLVGPGQSPGTFSIGGDFTQTSTGVLLIELAGYTQGSEYDLLVVGGDASLAGGLDIVLLDGFYPPYGSTFDVLTAAALTDAGFGLVGPNAGLFSWSIVDGTTLQLTSMIPEPTSLALLALAGLAALRRRR